MDNLTIMVSGGAYDFQITIKDPELVEIYRDNPDELRDYFRAAVCGVLGDLYQPKDIRRKMNFLNSEHQERKLGIIERLKS